jgi:hypothetical protein
MASRLKITGVILIIVGIVAWAAAGYAYTKVQAGQDALNGFSAAQNLHLSYNEDGNLIDRGTEEGANAILKLLGEDWQFAIADGELDPNDPVVNTATEYMYQMATIGQHTLHGTQTVVLAERVEWDGDGDDSVVGATIYTPESLPDGWDWETAGEDAIFMPGAYQVPIDGRYWEQFNRQHPLDGPARGQAWSGTVHGLFAQLGVGTVTATSLQMALGIVGVTFLMGLGFVISGGGLVWVGYGDRKEEEPLAKS